MIGVKLILYCLFIEKSLCRNYITFRDENGKGNLIWPLAPPQDDITHQRKTRYLQGYSALMHPESQKDQTSREAIAAVSSEEETESEAQSNYYMKRYKNAKPDPDEIDTVDNKNKVGSYEEEYNKHEQSSNEGSNENKQTNIVEPRRQTCFEKKLRSGIKLFKANNFVTDHDIMSSTVERKMSLKDSHKSNIEHSEERKTVVNAYCDEGKRRQMQKSNALLKDIKPKFLKNSENKQTKIQSEIPLCCKKLTRPLYSNKQMNQMKQKNDLKHKDETQNSYEHGESWQVELQNNNTYRKKMTKPQDAQISKERNLKPTINSPTKPKDDILIFNNHTEDTEAKTVSHEHTEIFEVPKHSFVQDVQQRIKAYESEELNQADVDYFNYPYSVSIQRKGAHYASGAFVGKKWVLTTAQEFHTVGETIRLFRMRLGSIDCKKGGILTPIKKIIIHPSFVSGQPAFDISMLMSPEPIPLTSLVKPIGISRVDNIQTIEDMKFMKFTITYWPRIVLKQGVIPENAMERRMFNSMRVSSQKLIPRDVCIKKMATVNVTLDNSNMCLEPMKIFHSYCMPDVGAPLLSMDGLWGITSGWTSPHCPAVPQTVIFTRVSSFDIHAWIDATMNATATDTKAT